jgi:Tripartite tricarboxylate transporter TctB family
MSTEPAPAARARRPVLVSRIALTAVGAAFFLGSFVYDWSGSDGSIGSAALPRTAGLLLVLVGLGLIAQELREGAAMDDDVVGIATQPGDEHADPARTRRKLVVVFAAMVVAALLIPITGLLLTLSLLTLFLCAVVERQPLLRSVAVAVGVGAIGHLLFVELLRVPLPLGLLDPDVWSLL